MKLIQVLQHVALVLFGYLGVNRSHLSRVRHGPPRTVFHDVPKQARIPSVSQGKTQNIVQLNDLDQKQRNHLGGRECLRRARAPAAQRSISDRHSLRSSQGGSQVLCGQADLEHHNSRGVRRHKADKPRGAIRLWFG